MYSVKHDTVNGELILKNANHLIGTVSYFYRKEDKNLELTRMFINFDYRNKNYSSILIKEMITYALKIGARCITANIDPELEDCYNSIIREQGFETDIDSSPIDLDDDERDILIEKAKKLRETRKKILEHLFQKFGFTKWNESKNNLRIRDPEYSTQWLILRL